MIRETIVNSEYTRTGPYGAGRLKSLSKVLGVQEGFPKMHRDTRDSVDNAPMGAWAKESRYATWTI